MSVINRMLKDLDRRTARAPMALEAIAAAPAVAPAVARAVSPATVPPAATGTASRWRLPVIVLLGAGAITAVAFADLSPLAPLAAPPVPAALNVAAVADPPAAAVATTAATATDPAPAVIATAPLAPPAPPAPASLGLPAAVPSRGTAQPAPMVAPQALPASIAPAPVPGPSQIEKRSLPQSADQQAALILRDAVELARTGQRQAALARALEALAVEPHHAAARQLAAVLQHESGATDRALALLRVGAELEAAPPALALLLARLLSTQGQGEEALAVLDRHGLRSGDAEGLRAGLLAQQGLYGRALVAYESAVRQQPSNPMWWLGLAVALESEGHGARARAAYAQARQLGLPREDLATYAEQRLRALD